MWRRTHLYLVPMALGALSKTPAVLLRSAPAAVERARRRRRRSCGAAHGTRSHHAARRVVRAIPAFIAAGALYLFVEGMNPPEQSYGGGGRLQNLWTQAWVAVRYAGVFFVPSGLSADSDWTALPSPWDVRVLVGSRAHRASPAGSRGVRRKRASRGRSRSASRGSGSGSFRARRFRLPK